MYGAGDDSESGKHGVATEPEADTAKQTYREQGTAWREPCRKKAGVIPRNLQMDPETSQEKEKYVQRNAIKKT